MLSALCVCVCEVECIVVTTHDGKSIKLIGNGQMENIEIYSNLPQQ